MATFWNALTELGLFGWVFGMIIVGIVVGGTVTVVKMWIKHRERMAMIDKGMDPGPPEKAYEKDEL